MKITAQRQRSQQFVKSFRAFGVQSFSKLRRKTTRNGVGRILFREICVFLFSPGGHEIQHGAEALRGEVCDFLLPFRADHHSAAHGGGLPWGGDPVAQWIPPLLFLVFFLGGKGFSFKSTNKKGMPSSFFMELHLASEEMLGCLRDLRSDLQVFFVTQVISVAAGLLLQLFFMRLGEL